MAYRRNFPRKTPLSVGQAAEEDPEPSVGGRRAFQVLGIDVLIDKKGRPRLLEVNSNPSMLIDYEHEDPHNPGTTIREPSPVDVFVKRRVITDVLRYVATGREGTAASGRRTYLDPVVGGEAGLPAEWTLLDRARRIYESIVQPSRGTERGMSSTQFVRLCVGARLLDLAALTKTDIELLFLRITQDHFDHRSLGLHSFARALTDLADLAFPTVDDRAERFECLLDHIAETAS